MNNSQARAILNQFLAVYAWRFSYCSHTWWAWNVDDPGWDYVDAKHQMARVFVIIAEDLFPDQRRIVNQADTDHVLKMFLRELRFLMTEGRLPAPPTPGSRRSFDSPAPGARPGPVRPSGSGPRPAVPSRELEDPTGTGGIDDLEL